MKIKSVIFCLCLLCCLQVSATEPAKIVQSNVLAEDSEINILILLSYQQKYPWTRALIDGYLEAVKKYNDKYDINLYVESMHLEIDGEVNHEDFHASILKKYRDIRIDAVIGDSIHAYNYLDRFGKTSSKYQNIPKIVYSDYVPNRQEPFFVVQGRASFQVIDNIKLLRYQNPDIEQLYVINHAKAFHHKVISYIEKSPEAEGLQVISMPLKSSGDLNDFIANIGNNSAVLLLPTSLESGAVLPVEVAYKLGQNLQVPVYTMWEQMLGTGVLGGSVINPLVIAKESVAAVLRYFEHGAIGQVNHAPRWVLDYKQLDYFDLPVPDFVTQVTYLNPESHIWLDYPTEVGLFIATGLLLLIGFMLLRQRQLRQIVLQTEKARYLAQQNQQLAEDSLIAKTKFLATVSHEIRTPINGITGAVPLIEKEPLSDKQKHYTNMIKYCGDSLLNTVNDILDFSKMEAKEFVLHKSHFTAHQLLTDIQHYANMIVSGRPIKISMEIDQLIDVPIYGDIHRIRQLFNNLVNNAIKFTEAGQVVIGAKVEVVEQQFILHAWIEDTGLGIDAKHQKMLFTPFNQVNNTLSKPHHGSGLGLAICAELVRLMDGEITVSSLLNEGSRFTFNICLEPGDYQLSQQNELDESAIDSFEVSVLLVEDNPINQEVISAQLDDTGMTVTLADNGAAALDLLRQAPNKFDIILMDLQMPTMNGYEAVSQIRSGGCGEAVTHIPVIALTAHMALDEKQAGFNDFDSHLVKPIKPHLLCQSIVKNLNREEDE